MLMQIYNEGLTIDEVIKKAKDKDDPFRLSGFGHRIYKTYDPRAKIAKRLCQQIIETEGTLDPLAQDCDA